MLGSPSSSSAPAQRMIRQVRASYELAESGRHRTVLGGTASALCGQAGPTPHLRSPVAGRARPDEVRDGHLPREPSEGHDATVSEPQVFSLASPEGREAVDKAMRLLSARIGYDRSHPEEGGELYNEIFAELGIREHDSLMLVHAFAEIASLLLLSATSEEVGDPFRGLDREEVLAHRPVHSGLGLADLRLRPRIRVQLPHPVQVDPPRHNPTRPVHAGPTPRTQPVPRPLVARKLGRLLRLTAPSAGLFVHRGFLTVPRKNVSGGGPWSPSKKRGIRFDAR